MLQKIIHNRSHHVWKDILSRKVYRILYHNDCKIYNLMHENCHKCIIMVEIRFSKINITWLHIRIEITMFIKPKWCIEIEFKVFKNQFECTNIRQKPKVCNLYSIYFPVLQYWHFNINKHFFVLIILQTYINIFNVKVHCFIL